MRAHDEPVVPGHRQPPPVRRPREVAAGPPGAATGPGRLGPAGLLHLQRTAGNASVAQLLEDGQGDDQPSPVKDVVGSGGGQPLDTVTRSFMESRLGHDFGDVRVHTDARASASAESVGANAYTVGRDVVFKSGQWSPSTDSGRRVLAHELTHVVQQAAGPVDGTPAPGGIRLSDPSDRFEREAEAVAERAMDTGPGVQRQEAGEAEDEELQMSATPGAAVQRQEEGVPEEETEE